MIVQKNVSKNVLKAILNTISLLPLSLKDMASFVIVILTIPMIQLLLIHYYAIKIVIKHVVIKNLKELFEEYKLYKLLRKKDEMSSN